MGLENIKLNFTNYLNSLKKEEDGSKYKNYGNADYNIFQYADEFKDYVSKNYNVTDKINSMSINDILNMEMYNGKLVSEEELAELTKAIDSALTGSDEADEADETNAKPNEGAEETNAQPTDAQAAEGGENAEGAKSVVNGLVEVINDLIQNETFINAFDTDKSGDISKEELSDFLNAANALDGDLENLSLDDILKSVDALMNGEEIAPAESETTQEVEEPEATDTAAEAQDTSSSPAAQQASYSPAVSSGYSPSRASNSGNNVQQEKTLKNMTEEELNAELSTAQGELKTKQDDLNKIKSGENSELQGLQKTIDEAYEEYQKQLEAVDKDMAKEVDDLKNDIDAKETEIRENDTEITTEEGNLKNAENEYSNAQKTTSSLQERLSSLQSSLSSAKDDNQKSKISELISGLQSEITQAKANEDAKKQEVEDHKTKLEELKEKDKNLKAEKEELDNKMSELENEIKEKYPEVAKFLEKYEKAQEDYKTKEAELTTQAQSAVETAQARVDEVQTAISNLKDKKTLSKYNVGYNEEYGNQIVDAASSLYPNSGFGGYCARGVSRSLAKGTGLPQTSGNGCDYGNVMANRSDFTELTDFNFNSMSSGEVQQYLRNLPAGTVCSFGSTSSHPYGHVMICDGKGNEISDGTNNIGTWYRNHYSWMRVFVPTG